MEEQHVFNSNLARAGRALVGISTWYIADETGIERTQIRKFERGIITLPQKQQEAIKEVLIEHGAVFLPDSNAGGYGVRLKFPSSKTRQIDRWEAEGGYPAEDDV
ncbi:MAG TPA: XRE family transcriptional regulator [Yaniella sp.]